MKNIFKKQGIVLILVSLILLNILPQTLCAFTMYITNNFLSQNTITIINIISYLITYILFAIGLSNFFDKKNIIKSIIKNVPIVIGYIVVIIFNYLLSINLLDNKLWISIIHLIINSLLLTISLIIAIYNISGKKTNLNIIKTILLIFVGIIIHAVPELVSGLFDLIEMNNLFIQSILSGIIYGLLLWIQLILYLSFIEKRLDKEFKSLKDFIWGIILLVLVIFLLIINATIKTDKVQIVSDIVGYSLASGDYAFDEMEVLTAKSFYEDAENFKCAYEYAIDNTYDISNCHGDLIELFKILNTAESVDILKEKVNNKLANNYDIEALMVLMHEREDEDTRKLTKYLISNMYFTRTTVLPSDLSLDDKTKLKEKLSKYDKHILVRKYADVYVEWLNQGELNNQVISVASKLAREYPDEISFQANALKFYITSPLNITGDRSVVDNFVNLTKDDISNKSDEEIIKYKTYVTLAYQACGANDKAISFLEEFKPKLISEDLGTLLLVSYKKAGKHKEAEKMALKVLDINEYNVDALSYLAIYKLQSDLDKSIEYVLKLAEIIRDKKDNYLEADIVLGVYRTYLTGFYDSPDSTFCPYKNFYKTMTEEQQNKLKNDDIMNMYLVGRGLEEKNLPIINNIIKKYDYITYPYYYRAVYEMSIKDYESAVKDLEKAISLGNEDPFFYSELGFAYEGIGDLQKSLTAFEIANSKVDELGLGSLTFNYNNIHNYFNVYINNAKHAMYESEGDHDEENN